MADDVDLDSPEAAARPDETFRALRARGDVLWSERHGAWLLLSHAEVEDGFRDPRLSSERLPAFERVAARRPPAFGAVVELFRGWMVFRDPPAHQALRDPVSRVFTPRSVERLAGRVAALCDELLDEAGERGSGDLKELYAGPLPALVIADLLGVPPEDRARFQGWSRQLATAVFQFQSSGLRGEGAPAAAASFAGYFRDLVRHYQKHPADNLVSRLVEARAGGGGLSDTEIVGASALLLFAGHSTTTDLLSNAALTLLRHPEALAHLRADPTLDASAVEELLRVAGPAKAMMRRVAEPHERAGHRFELGQRVYLAIFAANRDPAVFEAPDELRLEREPNPHLGFGWGRHHCLGAPLARLETQIALRRLLERFPGLALEGEAPVWVGGAIGHGLPTLPLRFR